MIFALLSALDLLGCHFPFWKNDHDWITAPKLSDNQSSSRSLNVQFFWNVQPAWLGFGLAMWHHKYIKSTRWVSTTALPPPLPLPTRPLCSSTFHMLGISAVNIMASNQQDPIPLTFWLKIHVESDEGFILHNQQLRSRAILCPKWPSTYIGINRLAIGHNLKGSLSFTQRLGKFMMRLQAAAVIREYR